MAVENYTARFNDAAWLKPRDIVLGGAGGINSWVALSLARIGHKLTIYDMDRYEDVNIAGQFCTEKDINVNKATALVKNLLAFTGTSHHSAMKEYKVNSFISNINKLISISVQNGTTLKPVGSATRKLFNTPVMI